MQDEMNAYFDDILSKFNVVSAKAYRTQHCLLHIKH